ncbi:MAG: hypothetical protein LC798_21190 [Chloroflexi bacterium]|nr:hypothetical protein [Chloroflexota bacterium]
MKELLKQAKAQASIDLAVCAVNRLPDYEAAVDALESLVAYIPHHQATCLAPMMGTPDKCSCGAVKAYSEARAALRRLRDEVPA